MGTTKALLTANQFGQFQLKTSELEDYELVDGELIPLASGTPLQAWTRHELGFALKATLECTKMALRSQRWIAA